MTKPRLSFKLLWKIYAEYADLVKIDTARGDSAVRFLNFAEAYLQSPRPAKGE
jgi:hypothetical protein